MPEKRIDEKEKERDDKKPNFTSSNDKKRFYQRKRVCRLCAQKINLTYNNFNQLTKYTTEWGKILPRRATKLCAKHQRQIALAVKRARFLAYIPYVAS